MNEIQSNDILKVYAFEGLCNRINVIVSALATKRPIKLFWAINTHCPVTFYDIFDDIGKDVEIINEHVDSYSYAQSSNELCFFYPVNHNGLVDDYHNAMASSYVNILASLFRNCPLPDKQKYCIGVQYRKHFPNNEIYQLRPFLKLLLSHLKKKGVQRVWVSSDCQRSKKRIILFLEKYGYNCFYHEYDLLKNDLDRSPSKIKEFIFDLRGLYNSQSFFVNSTKSTIIDSMLFQDDVSIIYAFDDLIHRIKFHPEFYARKNIEIINKAGLFHRIYLFLYQYKTLLPLQLLFQFIWATPTGALIVTKCNKCFSKISKRDGNV